MRKATMAVGTLALAGAAVAWSWGGAKARTTNVAGVAWHDGLTDARAEARRTGRPILLLSMFGRLDEAMPCANARTLRATLFRDPEFKAFAQKEAIPAWEMVRPVPHVTIDFGDGKKVVRTVRGNAVMYLVNADGKVFDAFPGVYTKDDFLPAARLSIARLAKADDASVAAYHEGEARPIPRTDITLGKAVNESATLRLMGANPFGGAATDPSLAKDDPLRARFLAQAARLSDLSLTPMTAREAVARAATGPTRPEDAPEAVIRRDSAVNMQRTRAVVHYYFASLKALPTPEEARDAVLGSILKVPYKDPTMGLDEVLMPGTPG